ncbi:hypothetical protein BD309DRAFT_965623 [Dichomitus squalens]|nr:hypothetical protein BD309DRAFT_965623 [Dichomitus squalens]
MFYGGFTCGLFSACQSLGATIVAPSLASLATAGATAAVGGAAIGAEISKNGSGDNGNVGNGGNTGNGANAGNGGNAGGGGDATLVNCSCVQCVCDTSCTCACRRQG